MTFYTCLSASIGSILEALYAGCKLARTETAMTMIEAIMTSSGSIVGARMRPVACPKLNVSFERFKTTMIPSARRTPTTAPTKPRQKPSTRNSERIYRGLVPIAAMVPISRTRS